MFREPVQPLALLRGKARWPVLSALVLIATALSGIAWLFIDEVSRHGADHEREDLARIARIAADTLDPELVARIAVPLPDPAALAAVRERLREVHDVVPHARFAYLVAARGPELVILADAEPADSPDYSPPGQVYGEAPPEFRLALGTGTARVSEPYDDRWGRWLTGIAPIRDPVAGSPIAVLGVDVAAAEYTHMVESYRNFAVAVSALFSGCVALAAVLVGLMRRYNARLRADLEQLAGAHEKVKLAGAVIDTMAEGLMVTDPDLHILSVNPAFERITGYERAQAVGHKPSLLFSGRHDDAFFQRIRAQVGAQGTWRGEIWNRRRDGTLYPQRTSVSVLRDAQGRVRHYACLLADNTDQNQLEARLRELASVDGLTGIASRRSFDEALAREWSRCLRDGRPLSLVMADIDFFKRYNDRYGHVAGDQCLRAVAGAIDGAVNRATDLAARYGGEEFAVILPDASQSAAARVAERIRAAVATLALPHADSSAAQFVTISLGVATVQPEAAMQPTTLVERADQGLYEAKHSGRNRVALAESPPALEVPDHATVF